MRIIFFDGDCAFCNTSVRKIIALDTKKLFHFAPLQGKTAQKELPPGLLKEDSLILLDDRPYLRARAILRILWVIGGPWKLIAWLQWLPIGQDLLYRLIAKHRHRLKQKKEPSLPADRLLP